MLLTLLHKELIYFYIFYVFSDISVGLGCLVSIFQSIDFWYLTLFHISVFGFQGTSSVSVSILSDFCFCLTVLPVIKTLSYLNLLITAKSSYLWWKAFRPFVFSLIFWSGSHLLSHTVSSIVSSAAYVLTIVFGMRTGVSHKRIATRIFVLLWVSSSFCFVRWKLASISAFAKTDMRRMPRKRKAMLWAYLLSLTLKQQSNPYSFP